MVAVEINNFWYCFTQFFGFSLFRLFFGYNGAVCHFKHNFALNMIEETVVNGLEAVKLTHQNGDTVLIYKLGNYPIAC